MDNNDVELLPQEFSSPLFLTLTLTLPCRKYTPLVSTDQRQTYKDDFNAEYDEYRLLHAHVENITRRFTQLDNQCRKLAPGTTEHQVSRVFLLQT